MRKLAIAATCLLTAILVATLASADSVGIGIKKTAPISGTGSSGSPLKLDVCSSGSGYESNGTSWACAVHGDITSAGATANMGLTGGATSGASTLGLLSTCANGEVLKSGASGTTWTCAADTDTNTTYTDGDGLLLTGTSFSLEACASSGYVMTWNGTSWSCAAVSATGDIEGVTAGAMLTGGGTTGTVTLDLAISSDFQNTADALDLSTAVTAPGTLDVAGHTTLGDATGDVLDVNGTLSKFGNASDGAIYFYDDIFATGYATNAAADLAINYFGYAAGWTQFRNVKFYDGKGALGFTFTGSTKAVDLAGVLNVTGLVTATAGVTTPANLTTTGTGDVVSADAITSAGNLTAGDAAADSHTINGTTTLSAAGRSQGFYASSSHSAMAAGDHYGIRSATGGTFDTTAGVELNVGFFSTANATRSAGANALWDVAYYANASGGQANYSFYGASGDFYNAAAGQFGSTLGVTGLVTATAGVTTSANLTTTGTGDVVSGDALTVGGNATIGDNIADLHTMTGIFSPSNGPWWRSDEHALNFGYGDAATATGYINYRSNSAFGASRNLIIADGQGATVATFTGSTKALALAGALTVAGNTTLGDADADTVESRGTFGVSGADATISACGTSPSITGEAQSFQLTPGTATTTCVVNFNRTFTNAPYCIFSAANARAALQIASGAANAGDEPYVTATTTQMTMTFVANTESTPTFNVFCPGRF